MATTLWNGAIGKSYTNHKVNYTVYFENGDVYITGDTFLNGRVIGSYRDVIDQPYPYSDDVVTGLIYQPSYGADGIKTIATYNSDMMTLVINSVERVDGEPEPDPDSPPPDPDPDPDSPPPDPDPDPDSPPPDPDPDPDSPPPDPDPDPDSPPPVSDCACKSEIARVFTHVDYVYTKVDYAQASLTLLEENVTALEAKIDEILVSIKPPTTDNSPSILDRLQSLATNFVSFLDKLTRVDDNVKELLPKEYTFSLSSPSSVSNSGKFTLSASASKVIVSDLTVPLGMGRRFSRVAGEPDKFKFGYVFFGLSNGYQLEMPIEKQSNTYDVPNGALTFHYWLEINVTASIIVETKTEVV